MNKIKLLTSLLGVSALSTIIVPMTTSCSNAQEHVWLTSTWSSEQVVNDENKVHYYFGLDSDEYDTKDINVTITSLNRDLFKTRHVVSGNVLKVEIEYLGDDSLYQAKLDLKIWTENWTKSFSDFIVHLSENFLNCDWSVIDKWTSELEKGKINTTEFCARFRFNNVQVKSMDDFIGAERKVTINGLDHVVKVIGTQHDTIADGTSQGEKAAFTFQLFTLLSNNKGEAYTSNWQGDYESEPETNNCWDFINSQLRKNLTGEGEGTFGWYDSAESKTALEMLTAGDAKLASYIKTVTKSVSINPTKTKGRDNWVVTNYNDKLFGLTATEMAQSGFNYKKYSIQEGSAYEYWTISVQQSIAIAQADRMMYDAAGTPRDYWTVSPLLHPYHTGHGAAYVKEDGYFTYGGNVGIPDCVSFAFCI